MGSNFFAGLTPELRTALDQFLASQAASVGQGPLAMFGTVPSARLVFITDATDTDTLTIAGVVYRFSTALVAPDPTVIQVTRGVSAAATRASLVNAINGVADPTVVPATAIPTTPIVADQVSTSIRIRLADKRGGSPVQAVSPSITLAEGLTPAASIWNCANLNVSGRAAGGSGMQIVHDQVTVTAQMITATSFFIEVPFAVNRLLAQVRTSTGAIRATTDLIAPSANGIAVTLAGGASPALQAGDIIEYLATT